MPYPADQINFLRAGSGPPAIMIHGNPATVSLWRPLVERLAAYRTLWVIDLPGFGGSPPPGDDERGEYALDRLAAMVLRFADLHAIDRFDLVGHSYGGALSLAVTAGAPERVGTLTAIVPMTDQIPALAKLVRSPAFNAVAGAFWRTAPGALRRFMGRNWTHVSYGAGYSRARAEEVSREGDRADLFRSATGLMLAADYDWYRAALERIAAQAAPPLMMIGAGRDRVIPHAHFERLAARLPHAIRHDFPRSGHVPMWQYPDEIAALVQDFWNTHSPCSS